MREGLKRYFKDKYIVPNEGFKLDTYYICWLKLVGTEVGHWAELGEIFENTKAKYPRAYACFLESYCEISMIFLNRYREHSETVSSFAGHMVVLVEDVESREAVEAAEEIMNFEIDLDEEE